MPLQALALVFAVLKKTGFDQVEKPFSVKFYCDQFPTKNL